MRASASVMLVALGTAIAGCGDDTTSVRTAATPDRAIVASIPDAFDPGAHQAPGTFVGAAKGDRTYVGFVVRGGRAVVYVCDGAYGDWFGGTVRNGHLAVRSKAGTVVDADVVGGDVRGTVRRGTGPKQSFTASPPSRPGTGLFAGPDPSLPGAKRRWIVLDGGIRGVSDVTDGTSNTIAVAEAPPADSGSSSADSGSSSGGTTTAASGDATSGGTPAKKGDGTITLSAQPASQDASASTSPPPTKTGSAAPPPTTTSAQPPTTTSTTRPPRTTTITDGTSNTIMVGETPPPGGGQGTTTATTTTTTTTRPPVTTITDGTSNTIVFGESSTNPPPRGTTITDGTSNTILVGESAPAAPPPATTTSTTSSTTTPSTTRSSTTTNRLSDGTSNTILVGESGAANGVAGGKGSGGLTTAPVIAAAPPPGKTTDAKAVLVTTSGTKKEVVAGGKDIPCATGDLLHAGLVVGATAAKAKKDVVATEVAQRQAVLLAAQLGLNGCKS